MGKIIRNGIEYGGSGRAGEEMINEINASTLAENILPFPYEQSYIVNRGVAFTARLSDGTISAKGKNTTAGQYPSFLIRGYKVMQKGTYTISVGVEDPNIFLAITISDRGNASLPYNGGGIGLHTVNGKIVVWTTTDGNMGSSWAKSYTFTIFQDAYFEITAKTTSDVNINVDSIIKPMLEYGTISHEYYPPAYSRTNTRDTLDNRFSGEYAKAAMKLTTRDLSENTDLNRIMTAGHYQCKRDDYAAAFLNCPVKEAFHLEVIEHVGYGQRIITSDVNTPRMFYRNYVTPEIWGPWFEIAMTPVTTT